MIVQANAGPSGHNRQQMHKRTAQKGPSLMKHKRLSEKQRIAALEQDAMNFVRPDLFPIRTSSDIIYDFHSYLPKD